MTAFSEMIHQRNKELDWKEMSIEDILELAIADEEAAEEYYRHAARLAGNTHTRRLLLRLSGTEREHAETLRRELAEVLMQRDMETGMAD